MEYLSRYVPESESKFYNIFAVFLFVGVLSLLVFPAKSAELLDGDEGMYVSESFVYGCPRLELVALYAQEEVSSECSLISWTDVECWSLVTSDVVSDLVSETISLYYAKVQGVAVYLVTSPIDEHLLDPDLVGEAFVLKVGLLPNVTYESWEAPKSTAEIPVLGDHT